MRIAIVGRGKVGSALASQLKSAGLDVTTRSGRATHRFAPDVDVHVLAVPDAEIALVAARLAPTLTSRSVVLHSAGARGPGDLAACARQGAAVAGFHPLVSFASRRHVPSLANVTFVADGDARAVRTARRLARALGARCVARPILGPAYHATAALLANGGAALAFAAMQTMMQLGMSQREAQRALAGLLQSVADNVNRVGLPQALTGPVARRDSATVQAHLKALRALSPQAATSYAALQPLILRCAEAQWQLGPEVSK